VAAQAGYLVAKKGTYFNSAFFDVFCELINSILGSIFDKVLERTASIYSVSVF
jgi:hypothetical protein